MSYSKMRCRTAARIGSIITLIIGLWSELDLKKMFGGGICVQAVPGHNKVNPSRSSK